MPSIILRFEVKVNIKFIDFLILEYGDSNRKILIHKEKELDSEKRFLILKSITQSLEEKKSINLIELFKDCSFKSISTNSKESKNEENVFTLKKDKIILKGSKATLELGEDVTIRTLGNVKILGGKVDLDTF